MAKLPKPVIWIGSSRKDLQDFPPKIRCAIGFALWQAQQGAKHLNAKPLRGFTGAGVLEVVEDLDGGTYRAVYTVKFAGAVFVLHAFQKKAKRGIKTPKHELDVIKKRLNAAEEQYESWRTTQRQSQEDDQG